MSTYRSNALVSAVGLAILVSGPLLQIRVADGAEKQLARSLPLPVICDSATEWDASWRPKFAGPDVELSATWRCDGVPTHVYVAQYATQAQGKEAVNELNQAAPPRLRRVAQHSTRRGADFDVIEWDAHSSADWEGETVWSWYVVGDRTSVSGAGTKLLEAWNAMRLRSETTSVVVLVVESPTADQARSVLSACATTISGWLRAT